MYFINNEISMYYEKYGTSNKTILILPGWGETRKTFINIINNLKDNYTIYIFDYPSFGKSPLPNQDLTIYDYANWFIQFIDYNNIINPIIIAHSFGGRIATLLTGYYKEKISKQILIDSAGIKPRKSIKQLIKQTTYKVLRKLISIFPQKTRNNLHKKLIKKYASNDFNNLNPRMYKTFKNIINENLIEYLPSIKTETLLIWGKLDSDTTLKDGLKFKKLIKNSELIVYQNSSHFSYLEQPLLTNQIINAFLKEK